MNKKVYQNINLTCVLQNTNPNFMPAAGSNGSNGSPSTGSGTGSSIGNNHVVINGMISQTKDGGVLFQETLPRKRYIRNSRLYEGTLVNIVRRKDGLYYPFLKAFKPEDIADKNDFAFRIYTEINEALNIID